jgi:hypothetical protein
MHEAVLATAISLWDMLLGTGFYFPLLVQQRSRFLLHLILGFHFPHSTHSSHYHFSICLLLFALLPHSSFLSLISYTRRLDSRFACSLPFFAIPCSTNNRLNRLDTHWPQHMGLAGPRSFAPRHSLDEKSALPQYPGDRTLPRIGQVLSLVCLRSPVMCVNAYCTCRA